jgi:hypothetical protein
MLCSRLTNASPSGPCSTRRCLSEPEDSFHIRPDIESLFNNMKGTAQERRRRCRHYGYTLNWLDRINQMLRRNQMALMNFQKRNGLSPG